MNALSRTNFGMARLITAVQQLSLARDLETIMEVVRSAAREMTGADGATFVLRDGNQCYYADENAIGPLWKGKRFPMEICISGWAMLNRKPAPIEDIYSDPRIPVDAYRPTFVKSLVMVPIRTDAPIGAIGNYWASQHIPSEEEIELLQALANTTSVAMENVQIYAELEQRMDERTTQLKEVNDELEAFAQTVSHDLRTPLREISGLCSILEVNHATNLQPDTRELFNQISESAERMGNLIDDLLNFSKVTQLPINKRLIPMEQFVRDILKTLTAEHYGRQVNIQIGEMANCMADAILLKQVLVNLLINAFKFTRNTVEACVEIGSQKQGAELLYWVRDNGVGFDMKFVSKLFAVFQRLHPQNEFEGTGVGLSIVHRIIKRHGGRIWAEAAPGAGATFYFTLPSE